MDCREGIVGAILVAAVLFKMCEENVRSKQSITIDTEQGVPEAQVKVNIAASWHMRDTLQR